ncbi:MAG TPA: DUF4149 domain-containing protein [Pyrinomonadaceae bacterium]|jgi:hypothetical protein|nr:DUF4149 domain-containing protein [Pyrinomonadaceae bacterium]
MLSFSRLILLACWFGAALFFGAVVAPTAFNVVRSFGLPNANEIAGSIVTRSLSVVNIAGFLIALLLLLTLFLRRSSTGRVGFVFECFCIVIMALGTGVAHWVITVRMRALRAAMVVPIDQIGFDDSRRIEFNTLHGYSVNALGLAMIAALVAMVLMARSLRN